MIAKYQIPDFTVDTPTVYKTKLDGNASLAQSIVGAFACHEAGTPNMTVLVDAGAISFMGQVPTIVGQQTSAAITAPVTNPRNDLVVIDANTGVASIITGTPAASPVDPAVTEGNIPVARIVLATSTTAITNALITDVRAPVLAVQGSPASLSVSTNTTLTQKQAGMTVYLSGVGVTCTLPSSIACKGARFAFSGTDANTQTLSGSFVLPDGSTASSWGITANEVIEVESTGSAWRVVRMAGKQIVKNATASTQQPIPIAQADARYVLTTTSFGGDVSGAYNAIVLATVNSNVGTFGSATQVPVLTVDAKGRVTAVSTTAVSAPVSSFNTRTGAVTLSHADVTSAVGVDPADHGAGGAGAVGSIRAVQGWNSTEGATYVNQVVNFTTYTGTYRSLGCLGAPDGGGGTILYSVVQRIA